MRTSATLSGVKLRNASDESCGGSLTQAFVDSCNSVFAPLGAKLGATRLVACAEAFGFNERPRVPDAKASTIPPAGKLTDSLAVGAGAIGQDRDLATPLQMAVVGATIAEHGARARPRIVRNDKVLRRRAVRATRGRAGARDDARRRARGHGHGRRDPRRPGGREDRHRRAATQREPNPKNTDAWFVAFAPGVPSRRWPWP